jgi:subtilisin family serine protease
MRKRTGISVLAALILVPALLGAAPGNRTDLDPALRALLELDTPAVEGVQAASRRPGKEFALPRSLVPAGASGLDPAMLDVFFDMEPGERLPEPGAIRFGDGLYGARLSLDRLRDRLATGTVRAARLARPLRSALDQSATFVGLDAVRRVEAEPGDFAGATGRGVVVGVVDSGLDFTHPDFQHADGSTRVVAYWDQGGLDGRTPREYAFGIEHSPREIDLGFAAPRDFTGHGTHVTGIAAGNGRGFAGNEEAGPYVGMAPLAELIVVRSVFTDFTVAAGVDYVFRRAGARDRPAVVNLSLGSQFGPHVGETPFERALQAASGPGRLVVAAAGNDAHRDQHAEFRLQTGEAETLELRFPTYSSSAAEVNFVACEAWFHKDDRYRVTVISPGGEESLVLERGDENRAESGDRAIVRGWNVEDQGYGTVLVDLEAYFAGVRASGIWRLRVEALDAVHGEVDLWISNWSVAGPENPRFLNFVDAEETVTVPGTSPGIITVGALVTRLCWTDALGGDRCYGEQDVLGDIAYFSGLGPTSDGREKPELVAPGYGVASARSSVIRPSVFTDAELDQLGTPDGGYLTLRGTSMAAPHVAGTVALLLEKFPGLTPGQALGRLWERASPVADARSGETMLSLHAGRSLLPVARLLFAELVPETRGLRVRWVVDKPLGDVRYSVYKGFSDEGPYHRLSPSRIEGNNPFEILDPFPEPGRPHVYRVAVADSLGLEEDLDTLRVVVPGAPRVVLRPLDPNPARSEVNIRFFLPPRSGGIYELDVVDVRGRLIRRVDSGAFGPDGREVFAAWDLRDETASRVAGGVFWVRLRLSGDSPSDGGSPAESLVRRVVVLP